MKHPYAVFYQQPMRGSRFSKQLDRLDAHCRNFLAHSPFAVIGSTRPGRGTDVSPRGDAPGFARVLDDRTIAIPDRPGNNRLDTMSNIVADAEVGLLFFIPGIDETLRIKWPGAAVPRAGASWHRCHQWPGASA